MNIVITGATGLLGWHFSVLAYSYNCSADFKGEKKPYTIVQLSHDEFDNDAILDAAIADADVVVHFAGVNRAVNDELLEAANPSIAERLIASCKRLKADPHIVYSNSIHFNKDTPYGNSKRIAGEILAAGVSRYTSLILPHIYGEGAVPNYNNVTATFIGQLINDEDVDINADGVVKLLHAGDVAQDILTVIKDGLFGDIELEGKTITVSKLHSKLQLFHDLYRNNIYPDFNDTFDLKLFNTYRSALYPDSWPYKLKLNIDDRGSLFEAVKGGGGGQTFFSTTKEGITRGNHFHLRKIERFLVLQGTAIIRIRGVLKETVWDYIVTGDEPCVIDMPTMHTHSIENIGSEPLITMFWSNEIFDSRDPDTFFDPVMENSK